jgi:hypothetical protein
LVSGEVAAFVTAARAAVGEDAGRVFDVFEDAVRTAVARIGQHMVAGAANLVARSTGPVVECAGGHPTGVHSVRPKTIATMLGPVSIDRAYHYCRTCKTGFHPADMVLGVDAKTTSTAVDKAVAAAGREMPFARAAALVAEITGHQVVSAKTADRIAKRAGRAARALIEADTAQAAAAPAGAWRHHWDPGTTAYVFIDCTGLPMVPGETAGRAGKQPDGTSKTREVKIGRFSTQTRHDARGHPVLDPDSTSYVATFDAVGAFTVDIAAEAIRRDFAHAGRTAVIADGATWIWRLADTLWPTATQIVDYYHAAEHLHDLIGQLTPHLPPGTDPAAFATQMKDHLRAGHIKTLTNQANTVPLPDPDTEHKIATATAYFTKNWFRMKYGQFKDQGLCIGSGAVEGACKT